MTREDQATLREFRVWVAGRLADRFTEGLDGVEQRDEGDSTVLSGEYVDDAQLRGVLDELSRLGIAVRRFEVIDHPEGERP